MPRDGSGVAQVYPGSNSNASNTVIQSALENNLVNDLYALINSTPTNILAGSATSPSITFTGDSNSGWYNVAADEIGMTLGGVLSWDYTATKTTYQWTDPGATVGPDIELYRISASPATSDLLGGITFTGRNTSAAKKTYAQMAGAINTATAGAEIGQIIVSLINSGTVANFYTFDPAGLLPWTTNTMGLGIAGLAWTGVDLGNGGYIRFNSTNLRLQHSAGSLALLGATSAILDLSDSTAGQIAFPASQHASANANTLDDYAEATWTPVFAFGGASVGQTYSVQNGRSTKIGRHVTLEAQTVLTVIGSSTGIATITGLPFASGMGATSVSITAITGFSTLIAGLTGTMSGSTIVVRIPNTTASAQAANTNFSSTSNLSLGVAYSV